MCKEESTKPSWGLALPFPTLHMGRKEAESPGEDFGGDRRVGISADGPSRPGLHPPGFGRFGGMGPQPL